MKRKPFLRTLFAAHNYERLFFLFLGAVLAGMYVASVIASPRLRQPLIFVVFTLAMNLHIALYWVSNWILKDEKRRRWLPIYIKLGVDSRAAAIAAAAQRGWLPAS